MSALALIIRGAGLGFLFTPINNVAYASLKPSEAQQASGLINLSRQLGGSFGIAILATYVTVHTQVHRVDLLANVYPGNPLVDERLRMLAGNLVAHGYGPDAAQRGALALLDQETMRQAAMLSYNDAWMLLLLTFLLVSPAILLLGHPGGAAQRRLRRHELGLRRAIQGDDLPGQTLQLERLDHHGAAGRAEERLRLSVRGPPGKDDHPGRQVGRASTRRA